MLAVSVFNWQIVVVAGLVTPLTIVGATGVGLTEMFRTSGVRLVQPVTGFVQTTVYEKLPTTAFGIVKLLGFAPPKMVWLPVKTAEPLVPVPGAAVVEPGVAALQPRTVRLVA